MTFPEAQIVSAPQSCGAEARFRQYFGVALPRGLGQQAEAMTWSDFVATYSPGAGPLRLGQWECTDADRPATRMGPQARNFRAVLAVGDRISTSTAMAGGPVAALTAMLHERGIMLETLKFHQMRAAGDIATFVYGTDNTRAQWAMGWADDSTQSALRALIACANRLLT